MRTLRKIGLIPLAIITLVVVPFIFFNMGASYLMRRRRADPSDPPSNYGVGYEEVHFKSRDRVPLVGWWIPAKQARGTIVMCQGQEGSMDRDTRRMLPLHSAGFNVLMFDFRAHGQSGGSLVSMGMYEKEDLLGALDYLVELQQVEHVGVIGFSMGAAVALITAALSERITSLVVDSPFGRLTRSVSGWLHQRGIPKPLAREIARWVLVYASMRTEGRMDQIDPIRWTVHIGARPILFIFGARDPYVSRPEIQRMISLAEGPTETWTVPDVGHRGAYDADPAEYDRRVVEWFSRTLSTTPIGDKSKAETAAESA